MKSNGKVLFNEDCSICNFEIKHYKKRSKLEYENCSQKGDKYLKALYVEFPDGSEIKGVEAFIYVWANTKGYQWLANFVSLPIIFSIAKIVYAKGWNKIHPVKYKNTMSIDRVNTSGSDSDGGMFNI